MHVQRLSALYLALLFVYMAGFFAGFFLSGHVPLAVKEVTNIAPSVLLLLTGWIYARALLVFAAGGLHVALVPVTAGMLAFQGGHYGYILGSFNTWGFWPAAGMLVAWGLPQLFLAAPLTLGASALSMELCWQTRGGTAAMPKVEVQRRRSILIYRLLRLLGFCIPAMLWEAFMLPIIQGWMLQ